MQGLHARLDSLMLENLQSIAISISKYITISDTLALDSDSTSSLCVYHCIHLEAEDDSNYADGQRAEEGRQDGPYQVVVWRPHGWC